MLVFIDESGCPGFKMSRGSDPIFAIGMVLFENADAAAATERLIRELHLSIPHRAEFKFSKTSAGVRDSFFTAITGCPFDVYAVIVRKELIYSQHLRANPDDFYSYFVRLLLGVGDRLQNARVRLDGSGGRDFEQALKRYLRQQLGSRVRDFRTVDSRNDQLTQLADMCIGAIARGHRDRRADRHRWRRMLEPRIVNVWHFR